MFDVCWFDVKVSFQSTAELHYFHLEERERK